MWPGNSVHIRRCSHLRDVHNKRFHWIIFVSLAEPLSAVELSLLCLTFAHGIGSYSVVMNVHVLILSLAEPLSAVELSLLKECLPFNLNVDSPVFRHQLHSCMKAVLVRARDGALSTIKDQENKKKKHTSSEPNSLRMIIGNRVLSKI